MNTTRTGWSGIVQRTQCLADLTSGNTRFKKRTVGEKQPGGAG